MRNRVTRRTLEDALAPLAEKLNMNLALDENGAGRVAVYACDGENPRLFQAQLTSEYLAKRECLAWIEGALGVIGINHYEHLRLDQVQTVWKTGEGAYQVRASVYGQHEDDSDPDLWHGYVILNGKPTGVFRRSDGDWTVRN